MKFRFESAYDGIDLDALEALQLDDEPHRAFFATVSVARTVVHETSAGGLLSRTISFQPRKELPRIAQRVLGLKSAGHHQTIQYALGSYQGTHQLRFDNLRHDLSLAGTFAFEARSHGVVHVVEGNVQLDVPLVGRGVEKLLILESKNMFERQAAFLREWLRLAARRESTAKCRVDTRPDADQSRWIGLTPRQPRKP